MSKSYMLTRKYEKRCTHNGIKKVPRPGNLSDLTQHVPIEFIPATVVEIPDDVDMTAVVEAGFIVEVRKPKTTDAKPKTEAPAKPKEDEKPKTDAKPKAKSKPKVKSKAKAKKKTTKKKR